MAVGLLEKKYAESALKLHPECKQLLQQWDEKKAQYSGETFAFRVREKVVQLPFAHLSKFCVKTKERN